MDNRPASPASPESPEPSDQLRAAGSLGVLLGELCAVADTVAALGGSSSEYDAFTDEEVLTSQNLIAGARRGLETRAAWVAATLARRSRPELGGSGLAARQGFLSPEEMIQKLTGSNKGDAVKLLAVGRLLAETDAAQQTLDGTLPVPASDDDQPAEPGEGDGTGDTSDTGEGRTPEAPPVPSAALPWHAPIGRALHPGRLTVDKAESLRKGLGDLDQAITAEKLAAALAALLVEAENLNADQLYKRARRVRDLLDVAGIQAREKAAYDERYLRVWKVRDGRVRMTALYSPEDGEYIISAYDAVTSPRRGGVRFVDKEQAAWAKKIKDDPRSVDQIAADGFLAVFKAGGDADPRIVFGGRRSAVRILTTRTTGTTSIGSTPTPTQSETSDPGTVRPHTAGTAGVAAETHAPTEDQPSQPAAGAPETGPGVIEGTMVAVSAATVERNLCDTGGLALTFDQHGHGVDLGREQRLFSLGQRALLGARDGGCRWADCDRPPSWTEAHHLLGWSDDHGPTDLAQGILLCRPHHLKLHNEGWRIILIDGAYGLKPPSSIDPDQHLTVLPPNNPSLPENGSGGIAS
ncbi:DUF222 domain-containing protein [Cryobacterium sp. GrIS_2_6]|uniref:HNH endonuclease signature motif containing protein n=1 Tax=Cryobacterium sp. GrIS_2_6 TaxID=3162785 RepID=UPI002E09FE8B|nr:hypothetical protein [Cryobacterium psychrotolerans]